MIPGYTLPGGHFLAPAFWRRLYGAELFWHHPFWR